MLPVALQHPILLDMASRDMLEVSEEPLAPAQLRGFRLHTIWARQPGEDLTHQVGFPHLFGKSSLPLLDYAPEIIPLELFQGPKLAITLKPPSKDHWNTASDLVLPVVQDQLREQREAKQAVLHLEEGSEGVEVSPMAVSAPRESLPRKAEDNLEASSRQPVIDITQGILERIHAIHLQALYEMGCTRELDRTLAHALMAEFARVQLVIGKDLTKSLIALQLDLETSSQGFLSDICRVLNLHPMDLAAHQVKTLHQRFQEATSLKVHLPLLELQAAQEALESFLHQRLQEIGSRVKTRELMERLTGKMMAHASLVCDLISTPELAQQEVALQVNTGLAAIPSLEANIFLGILEGVTGRLGLSPPGMTDPPVSARVGVSRQWASALQEAIQKTEGKVFQVGPVTHDILPPRL